MAKGGFGGGIGGGGVSEADLEPLVPRDGTRGMLADLDLFRDPVLPLHSATKRYVDLLVHSAPHMVGVFSAPTNQCSFFPQTGYPSGPTPPANTLQVGEYLVCIAAGVVPPGGEVGGSVWAVGDWLICIGQTWGQIPIGSNFIARQIKVVPPVFNADNVQDALENIEALVPQIWITGSNYAAGSSVVWDGLAFRVLSDITNAPATPDFSQIRFIGAPQGDYWRGVPQGWVTNNWIHLATMPSYGTYRYQMDFWAVQGDESMTLEIATTYNAASVNVISYARNPAGMTFDRFRLSAMGGDNPVRLEGQIRNAAAGPDFKLFISGFARQNNSNTTMIPKPPIGQATNLGGTELMVLNIPENVGPSMVTNNLAVNRSGWIRFQHANTSDIDDGRVGARLFGPGLNIVGIVTEPTETGNANRRISLWGQVELMQGGDTMTAGGFICPRDDWGLQCYAGGRFYKKLGTGMTIRANVGNTQPGIENNDGTGRRDIIDTVNGDARYGTKTELNAKVTKAGDTMTGDLWLHNANLYIRKADDAVGLTPGLWFRDNTGRDLGGFRFNLTGFVQGQQEAALYCYTMNGGYGFQEVFRTVLGGPPYVDFRARPRVNGVPVVAQDELEALRERVSNLEARINELERAR